MGFHNLGIKLAFGSKNHLWSHVLSLLNLILFGHLYPKNNVADRMTNFSIYLRSQFFFLAIYVKRRRVHKMATQRDLLKATDFWMKEYEIKN